MATRKYKHKMRKTRKNVKKCKTCKKSFRMCMKGG